MPTINSHGWLEKNGASYPLGATLYSEGANFSIFCKNGNSVSLLFFDKIEDVEPSQEIELNNMYNQTYNYWHIFVKGVKAGQLYGYRINGPFEPTRGHVFDSEKILLDPYSKAIAIPDGFDRGAFERRGKVSIPSMKSVLVDLSLYDWEGDAPLSRPFSQTIIYEMHVGGFTKDESSNVQEAIKGKFLGLIQKIPYLVKLGITAVELLPVFHFDEQDAPMGLVNYWGYSPISFFAPHQSYSTSLDPTKVLDEFRDMVKALHAAGIEVILDVVYNHTAEAGKDGPCYSFRGIDNSLYYMLYNNSDEHMNFSGCGNTFNANQAVVRRMIIDSLHFWVEEMHVDGFRFDLASILSRDESGHPIANPPVLLDIDSDPILSRTKLIAEAWDAAGLYQVGSFVGDRWKEWNGKFRDDIRKFMRGDEGTLSNMVTRLIGSPDIFVEKGREPERSINFVTCHDGFTLYDLVSYNWKHNSLNKEENRDGTNDNWSWNCGVEGNSNAPYINQLRNRQIKNFLTLTLVSIGAPMLSMGDEVCRTQNGNNNAYCQDNKTSWFDWNLEEKHEDVFRFVQLLISGRMLRDMTRPHFNMCLSELLSTAKIVWHGIRVNEPDWSHFSRSIACTIRSINQEMEYHFMFNAYQDTLPFELPLPTLGGGWKRWIDTFLESPDDICHWQDAVPIENNVYNVNGYSIVVLISL
ncbi:MAG: glycogen debranching enzyme GlgX [Bacteroidetes bacterium]|nr:MAG: glycogen debranching enzyme GlgX [Bacteroidota bacterium]